MTHTTSPRHQGPYCRIDARPTQRGGGWWVRCYTCDTVTLQNSLFTDQHARPTHYYRRSRR